MTYFNFTAEASTTAWLPTPPGENRAFLHDGPRSRPNNSTTLAVFVIERFKPAKNKRHCQVSSEKTRKSQNSVRRQRRRQPPRAVNTTTAWREKVQGNYTGSLGPRVSNPICAPAEAGKRCRKREQRYSPTSGHIQLRQTSILH